MFQEWRHQTLSQVLRHSARAWPDRVAVSVASEQISYAELEQRVAAATLALQMHGVRRGRHIAYLMESSPRWLEVLFAATELGATLIPLNLTWTDDEIVQGLALTDSEFLLISEQHKGQSLRKRVPGLVEKSMASGGVLEKVLLADATSGFERLDALPDHAGEVPPEDEDRLPLPDDTAMMVLTSGSTSFPKPAIHTHESVLCGAAHFADGLEVTAEDVFLHCMPNYHVGSIATACLTLMRGARLELMEFFDPGEAIRRIHESRATLFWGFDTHFIMMRDHPSYESRKLSSLQRTMVAANPATFEQVRAMGFGHIGSLYGSTEYMGSQTFFPYRDRFDAERMRLSNGRPTSGDVRIARPDGGWAQAGEMGEICVRGPALFKGYYKLPEETAACLDAEGFFHSGDLGFVDSAGYLYYRGRLKEMVKSGGENVSALEVETFLLSEIQGVKRAMVCATPHEKWGEAVTALLDLAPGVSWTEEEIQDRCRGKLAGYKIPKRVVFIPSEDWPVTPTGKLNRKVLAEQAAERFQKKHD